MTQENLLYEDWLIAIRERDDKGAFGKLYHHFWDGLYGHALLRTRDAQQAEDIVQELFIQFWEKRDRLDSQMTLPGYLYGMLKYKIVDFFNSNKIKPQLLDFWAEDLYVFVQQHPEELETYRALEELLSQELDRMPTNMKQAILLKWDEFSIRDIATRLGLSEQTVKNNISEGSKRLKHALLSRGIDRYSTMMVLFALQSLTTAGI
ncbi:sigma-70 family RNA polymerase sigma factor [Sphingobacterium phlebotomi]|uniref:Sigma-70 family RNA polymerase sigma factor n=1 Tax=Sphingobacterium phlebotomi TaxID=2605433 RepID=A0A5D4H8M0_9SPHI|nr:sigma-70 family RNA polymerase sigma factor [Sphingobacterium phlebotomi]TYR36259.1 sigma-70 family RNA polymerase sigma factor [Sphingobacterium phlebotomi]